MEQRREVSKSTARSHAGSQLGRRWSLFDRMSLAGAVFGSLLTLAPSSARAEIGACAAISSVPFVINRPGTYCLMQDLTNFVPDGKAIRVDAANVIIDLNGHRLSNRGANDQTSTYGIFSQDHPKITIRNGTIQGFGVGIYIETFGDNNQPGKVTSHLIEGLRVYRNRGAGISVQGTANIIRRNQVTSSGVIGISAHGKGNRVSENEVVSTGESRTGASTTRFATGISGSGGTFIERNHITNQDNPGRGTGIAAGESDFVFENHVSGMATGIEMIRSRGIYKDNVVIGASTPFQGGTDGGGNVSVP